MNMLVGSLGVYKMNMKRALINRRMLVAVALVLFTQFLAFLPCKTAKIGPAFSILLTMNLFELQSLIPCICAWVYANTYLYDTESGFLRYILMRTKKKDYIKSILLFSFASAFFVSITGVALTIGLLGIRFGFIVSSGDMDNLLLLGGSALIAENKPFAFCCFHVVIHGLSCGIWSVSALMFSVLFKDASVAVMSPVIIAYTMLFVASLFGKIKLWGKTVMDWHLKYDIFMLENGLGGSNQPSSFFFAWCIRFIPILILSCVIYYAVVNKRMRAYV